MRRSLARGQVEPVAALAAVFAVCAGLAVYAGAVGGLLGGDDREVAETALDAAARDAGPPGVVTVDGLRSVAVAPHGWTANLTLRTAAQRIHLGPTPPDDAQRASRQVAVRLAPGRIRPGSLTVEVWQ
ncbi:hypothetical protein ACKVMT_15290 [Halobacteriales archaeon Cl-PHB]